MEVGLGEHCSRYEERQPKSLNPCFNGSRSRRGKFVSRYVKEP